MNISEFLTGFYPALLTLLTAGIVYVGNEVRKEVPLIISYVVSKIGLSNYTTAKATAVDVWKKIEEDTRLGDFVGDKLTQFAVLLRKEIPEITDAQIDLFNKSIAGEVNKDKAAVIKDIEVPVAKPIVKTIVVTPILKYVTPDGKEVNITPVEAPVADTEVVKSVEATIAPSENVASTPVESVVLPEGTTVIPQ